MATNRVINGTTYVIPDQGDEFLWGTGLSAWIGAVTNGALFTQGGSFPLASEVDFGTRFGLKALYLKSESTVANSGVVRLGNSDSIVWAGVEDGADVGLTLDAENYLVCNTGFSNTVNWISILAFGADPTGVEDSTTAIQDAVAAAGALKTSVYAPRGTYKISSTITNNSSLNWMGIVGESMIGTVFSGASLSANAFMIQNAPVGFGMSGFTLTGPGQSGNLVSGIVCWSGGAGIADQIHMGDIEVTGFAQDSFAFNNPIASTFARLRAQSGGVNGFAIYPHPSGATDGGTSTTWLNCYANGIKCANSGAGYNFNYHQYFSMQACAADSCANSYYFNTCNGGALDGCGNEANITTSGGSNGVSVTLNSCTGMTHTGQRTYNLPSTDSIMFNILGGGFHSILNPVYIPSGTAPNNEIVTTGSSSTILSPYSSGKNATNYANVKDNGANNYVAWGRQLYRSLTLNTDLSNNDPTVIFANASGGANQTNYVLRRWSSIGPNGSFVISSGAAGTNEVFLVQDASLNGSASFVQTTDPLNTTSGRMSFGVSGAHLDYNGDNASNFTLNKNTIISANITAANATVNGVSFIPAYTNVTCNASYTGNVSGFANAGFWTDPFGICHLRGLIEPTSNISLAAASAVNIANGFPTPGGGIITFPLLGANSGAGTIYTSTRGQIAANGALQIYPVDTWLSTNLAFISLDGATYSTH